MKLNFTISKLKAFRFSSIQDKKTFRPNRHFELINKSTKDKFKTKEMKENLIKEEKAKINQTNQEKVKEVPQISEEQIIDPKEKYKAFKYNFPDEESKKRFENYSEYEKLNKALGLHHNSIFKIKNFFVRRNFLKLRTVDTNQEIPKEKTMSEQEKIEALEKMIDPFKEKILIYETNANIIDLVNTDRKVIKFSLFTTILNNIYILTSFKYLFEKTFTSYCITYYFNISVFFLFLYYKKLADDSVLQAEYLPKSKELLIVKRNAINFKIYEEKVNINDLKYFKSKRVYEKNSKYFRNVKNNRFYAFHENGIWHQEGIFNILFDMKKDIDSNYI